MTARLYQAGKAFYKATIGLEIHCQIKSKSKLFSNAPLPSLASAPNSCVTLFDAAVPGTLPVLNKECVRLALTAAMALNCTINKTSTFERKHYFYQDLPLGYQITQQECPIGENGVLEFVPRRDKGNEKSTVKIARIQIEQDSGKSVHDRVQGSTLVDLNRAGCGLLEIVFEPELHSAADAATVVKTLQQLFRHIGVCEGNMEDGSLRVDVNVSVAPVGQNVVDSSPPGTRVEVKNLNSLQRVVQAVEHEAMRQAKAHAAGLPVRQETRGFDAVAGATYRLRSKETSVDYRFMRDPDIPRLRVDDDILALVEAGLPETPEETASRLQARDGLSREQVTLLIGQDAVFFFDDVMKTVPSLDATRVFHWISTVLQGILKGRGLTVKDGAVRVDVAADLLVRLGDNVLSPAQVREVVELLADDPMARHLPCDELLTALDMAPGSCGAEVLHNMSGTALDELCMQVVVDPGNAKQLKKFHAGKRGLLKYFVGEVMRTTRGTADPQAVTEAMERALDADADAAD